MSSSSLSQSKAGSLLVIESLSKRLKELESDWIVENYFERVEEITNLRAQIQSLKDQIKTLSDNLIKIITIILLLAMLAIVIFVAAIAYTFIALYIEEHHGDKIPD